MNSFLKTLVVSALPLALSFACSSSDPYPELESAMVSDAAFIPKGDAGLSTPEQAPTPVDDALADAPGNVIALEAKPIDCSKFSSDSCDPDEPNNPFRCSLSKNNNLIIADDQQIHAWGKSRCYAMSALEAKLCSEKVIRNGATIDCHPDNTPVDECNQAFENCDAAPQQLTKCFAKEIDSIEVAWSQRPESWGKSECEARNKLKQNACRRGIAPSEMKAIACEKETSPAVCPPIQQNCLVQGEELVECRIRKIGNTPLREPLKGMGSTTCEASYRVKDLACRWQRKEITDLNDVECRSVSKGETFSTAAKAKTYKKVKRL